jgi:hypothetical protein
MTSITRHNIKFGSKNPIPVERIQAHRRTLTQAVDAIRARIDETIAILNEQPSLRQMRAKSFRSPMAKKYRRNLLITIGYGRNNEAICPEFKYNYFDSLPQAIEFLQETKILISKGKLDVQINAHLQKLSKRAEHAREKRAAVDTGPKTKHTEHQDVAKALDNLSKIQNYERKAAA